MTHFDVVISDHAFSFKVKRSPKSHLLRDIFNHACMVQTAIVLFLNIVIIVKFCAKIRFSIFCKLRYL